MPEMNPLWKYPLVKASEFREGSRTSTPPEFAARLVGADCNTPGGIRPFPGFRTIVDLTYGYGDDITLSVTGGAMEGGTMTDFYAFNFRIDDTQFGYGFIYRVLNNTDDKAAFHFVFRVNDGLTWYDTPTLGMNEGLITPESYNGEQFQIEVNGRFIYGFRTGKRPFRVHVTEPTPGTYQINVVEETGPGPTPLLLNPANNSASANIVAEAITPTTGNDDVLLVLPALTPPVDEDAEGRIVYFGFSGVSQVDNDTINFFTNPFLLTRTQHTVPDVDTNLVGPSDLGLWATPPQADPTFQDVILYEAGTPAVPVWDHPDDYGERNGWGLNSGAYVAGQPVGLTDDGVGFVWAYRLYDSRTGTYSGLSTRLASTHDGYGQASVKEFVTHVSGTGNVSGLSTLTFPMLYLIYDDTKYDTLILYRGATIPGVGLEETVLFQDSTITLADFLIDTQPGPAGWSVAAYFPVLSNEQLVLQQSFAGDDVYLDQMPYAGSALYYEGTMLLGKMGQIDDEIGGAGKFMWSDLNSVSVELVPASNRYPLKKPSEEILRFLHVDPNVVGMSKTNLYLIRREINYLKAMAMHAKFGVVNHKAGVTLGSEAFFVSNHGLYSIRSNGALTSLPVFNHVLTNEWLGELDQIQMASDGAQSVVYILNPVQERLLLLWVREGRTSELDDANFIHVAEGPMPFSQSDAGLEDRAIFVQYCEQRPAGVEQHFWRVFVPDYGRTRGTKRRMLDPTGSGQHTLAQALASPNDDHILIDTGGGDSVNTSAHGIYLYVMDGPNIGKKIKVRYASLADRYEVEVPDFELEEGTRVAVSPVYMEWTGAILGLRSEEGVDFAGEDYFAGRHVDSLKAAFTDVSYDGPEGQRTYLARMYEGDSEDPYIQGIAKDGLGEVVETVMNGPPKYASAFGDGVLGEPQQGAHSNALFPAVAIFVPDLDFRLLSVRVYGTITGEDSLRSRD